MKGIYIGTASSVLAVDMMFTALNQTEDIIATMELNKCFFKERVG